VIAGSWHNVWVWMRMDRLAWGAGVLKVASLVSPLPDRVGVCCVALCCVCVVWGRWQCSDWDRVDPSVTQGGEPALMGPGMGRISSAPLPLRALVWLRCPSGPGRANPVVGVPPCAPSPFVFLYVVTAGAHGGMPGPPAGAWGGMWCGRWVGDSPPLDVLYCRIRVSSTVGGECWGGAG
jgi:hypothetical protein